MKKISIDNGETYLTAAEAIAEIGSPDCYVSWDAIVEYMDDDTREQVHSELAPCTELEFLARYLEIAEDDLIVG